MRSVFSCRSSRFHAIPLGEKKAARQRAAKEETSNAFSTNRPAKNSVIPCSGRAGTQQYACKPTGGIRACVRSNPARHSDVLKPVGRIVLLAYSIANCGPTMEHTVYGCSKSKKRLSLVDPLRFASRIRDAAPDRENFVDAFVAAPHASLAPKHDDSEGSRFTSRW